MERKNKQAETEAILLIELRAAIVSRQSSVVLREFIRRTYNRLKVKDIIELAATIDQIMD